MIYVLDACALIAYLNREPEGIRVKELIESTKLGNIDIYMCIVNLVEVYYGYVRDAGEMAADAYMEAVSDLPIRIINTITDTVCREAARFKGLYSMSLADAFACGTAKSLNATLVTKDSEIEAAQGKEHLSVLWIK
ncbi:hypothetical protein AGMMS50230_12770 [Spirochaetia bacterium]|nr:hypothetical protein AGMMS50230_12770 [Spirochaetia bacterium]